MSLDGGYPRIFSIPVPADIPLIEAGDYVSNEVVKIMAELGHANYHRRSVSLKALEPRFYVLQLETPIAIRLPPDKVKEYGDRQKALEGVTSFSAGPVGKGRKAQAVD